MMGLEPLTFCSRALSRSDARARYAAGERGSGLYEALLGFFGAIILSVIAERVWRRRRSRHLSD